MWLTVNGEKVQNGSTRTMVYGVAYLVSYLSQFMTLHPGDVISTGTPPGVGLGMKPPRYLKPGDTMRLAIEGRGTKVTGHRIAALVCYEGVLAGSVRAVVRALACSAGVRALPRRGREVADPGAAAGLGCHPSGRPHILVSDRPVPLSLRR